MPSVGQVALLESQASVTISRGFDVPIGVTLLYEQRAKRGEDYV